MPSDTKAASASRDTARMMCSTVFHSDVSPNHRRRRHYIVSQAKEPSPQLGETTQVR